MKKILALLLVASTFFISCSKTDDPVTVDPTSSILVKKMVTSEKSKSSAFGYTTTVNFTYNGNKIVSTASIGGDVFKRQFTYEGNLITKNEGLDEKGDVTDTATYTYNSSGNLTSRLEISKSEPYLEYKTEYTHNSDGTITYVTTRKNTKTNTTTSSRTGKLTYIKGNLTKKEEKDGSYDYTIIYEYDTKNNPFKNITGLNKLLDDEALSINNVVKSTRSSTSSSIGTSVFTYNASDFVTKEVKETEYDITTIEYTY